MENDIRVGVGVLIFKDGKILLGKRKGAHAAGQYAFTGGHLEYMETFEECARRETMEEAGIEIENVRVQFIANNRTYAPVHYIHVGVIADWKSGEPTVLEPDKRESWFWADIDQLPEPMMDMAALAIDSYKHGTISYDDH